MTTEQTAPIQGRKGTVEVDQHRADDPLYLLDKARIDTFLERLDLIPETPWRWITITDPIAEDGSTRLILQGQLPGLNHFSLILRVKSFARWAGYRFEMFGSVFDGENIG